MTWSSYRSCVFVLCVCSLDVFCFDNIIMPSYSLLGRWKRDAQLNVRENTKRFQEQTEHQRPLDFVLKDGSLLDLVIVNSKDNKNKYENNKHTFTETKLLSDLDKQYRLDPTTKETSIEKKQSSVHRIGIHNQENLGVANSKNKNKLYESIITGLIHRLTKDMEFESSEFTYLMSTLIEARNTLHDRGTQTILTDRDTSISGEPENIEIIGERVIERKPSPTLEFHTKQETKTEESTNTTKRINNRVTNEMPSIMDSIQRIFDIISNILSRPDPAKQTQNFPTIIDIILNNLKKLFPDGIIGANKNKQGQNSTAVDDYDISNGTDLNIEDASNNYMQNDTETVEVPDEMAGDQAQNNAVTNENSINNATDLNLEEASDNNIQNFIETVEVPDEKSGDQTQEKADINDNNLNNGTNFNPEDASDNHRQSDPETIEVPYEKASNQTQNSTGISDNNVSNGTTLNSEDEIQNDIEPPEGPNETAGGRTIHKVIIEEENGATKFTHHIYANLQESYRTIQNRKTLVDDFEMIPIAHDGQVLAPKSSTLLDVVDEPGVKLTFRAIFPSIKKDAPKDAMNLPQIAEAEQSKNIEEIRQTTAEFDVIHENVKDFPENVVGYDESCRCGRPNKKRIINGTVTDIRKYPWMVQLVHPRHSFFFCGGSIITRNFVLTAAHCVAHSAPKNVGVIVGHSSPSDPGYLVSVEDIIINRQYKYWAIEFYDIALLKLSGPLMFNERIMPICLPQYDYNFEGLVGTITGWGVYNEYGEVSDELRVSTVNILEKDLCRIKSEYFDVDLNAKILCAKKEKVDSCQGDSGGPISIENDGVYTIVGITSWGYGCAEGRFPGVYTKVSAYYEWIKSNTKRSAYCLHPLPRSASDVTVFDQPDDLVNEGLIAEEAKDESQESMEQVELIQGE